MLCGTHVAYLVPLNARNGWVNQRIGLSGVSDNYRYLLQNNLPA
jgi:hypothetical protein